MSSLGRLHLLQISTLLTLCSLLLQGCATSAFKTANMRNLLQVNQIDKALIQAEQQLQKNSDGVMENFNVGTLRRLAGDYKGSNQAFEIAKQKIAALYTTSVSEQAAAAVINDEIISFQGDRFEQVLLHFYMALNFLDLGELDSARVELLQSQVKMNEWGEPKDDIPFMRYFSGIIYEMLGEDDSATVSYRKAVNAYRITQKKNNQDVPLQLKYDLLRMLAKMELSNEFRQYSKQFGIRDYRPSPKHGMGELVVILENGMVPQRQQRTFRTWSPALSMNIKVAVPDYPYSARPIYHTRLTINGIVKSLETTSDLDAMARAALAENMAAITTRAIARAVIKKRSEKKVGEKHGLLGEFAMMVVNQGTEIADTRCWNTLPQVLQVSRTYLPAGSYNLAIDIITPAGVVVDKILQKVTISAGKTTLYNKRWVSPEKLPVRKSSY